MTCARREAGAHGPAASSPSRSPSSRRPSRDRSRPDPLGGRARRFLLLPVLALLLGALGLLVAAPAQAQTATKLVSNTGQANSGLLSSFSNDLAQAFTTGSNAAGYKLTRADMQLRDATTTAPTYSVHIYSNSSGSPGNSIGTLTNPASLPKGADQVAQFTASGGGIDLAANTTYFLVIDVTGSGGGGLGSVGVPLTSSNAEDSGAAAGWSIADTGLFRAFNTTGAWSTSQSSRKIAVYGYATTSTNSAATGKPTISGTARVGQTLTAAKGTIADTNGVTKADAGDASFAYIYQWIRVDSDGTSNATDISGAMSSTYTLAAADQGKKVKVKVGFKDDAGNFEARTSDAYPTSGTIAAAPTTPAIAGLSATPAETSVRLNWTNPGSCSTIAGCGYRLRHRTTGGTWGSWANLGVTSSRTVSSLSAATSYEFMLERRQGGGTLARSTISATTLSAVPDITAISVASSSPSGGWYRLDDEIKVEVTFDEIIAVSGSPQLKIRIGTGSGSEKTAACARKGSTGDDRKKLVCTYTVASGDEDTDGISVERNKLSRPSSVTIKDGDNNDATITYAASLALAAQSGHKVDAKAPSLSVGTPTPSGPAKSKSVIITVTDSGSGVLASSRQYWFEAAATDCNIVSYIAALAGIQTYTSGTAFTIASESRNGQHVCVRVGDNAGNIAYAKSAQITGIDTTDPGIAFPSSWAPKTGVVGRIVLSDSNAKIKKYGAVAVAGTETTAALCDTASEVTGLTTLETPSASFNFDYAPPTGSVGKKVCVYAEDAAGNSHARLWGTAIAAGADTTAPGKPSGLALASGTSSPGNDATPSVEVTVTEAGGKVTLYSDSTCTSAASAATSVTDTSSPYEVTVDATALTADGAVTFYAKHADAANNASDCSTASVAYTYDGTRPGIELPTARPQVSVASSITLTDATAKVKRYGAIEVLGNETTAEPCDTPSEIGSALQTETPPATPVSLSYTPTSGSVGKLLCVYVEDAAGNRRSALWTTAVAALTPPAPPSLSADTPAANTIRLIWSWSRLHGRPDAWVIEVSEDAGTTWTELAVYTLGELYRHTGLAAGAVRHYRVKARNTVGGVNRDSAWSPVASATALDPNAPARPTGFTGRAVDRGAKLTWDDPNDATITGYEYRQDPGGGFGPWTAIPGSGAGTTMYTVTGLSPGLTYAFQVRAVKGTLKGVPSISTRVRPTGSVAPGTLTVPWDWAHLPKGADGSPAFTDGESFRLLFMTLGKRDATSLDIAEYNRFVQAGAPTAGTRALVSTQNVHAEDNTATTGDGVPIWWLGGEKVADGYADFWDGSWDSRAARSAHGDPAGGIVWTGSGTNGNRWLNRHAGATRVRYGWPARAGGAVSLDDAPATRRYALYGLSPVVTVEGAQPAPGPNAVRVVQGYRSDYRGRAHLLADSLRVSWNRFDAGFVCDYLVEWRESCEGEDEGEECRYSAERRMEVPGVGPTHATIGELEPGTAYTVRVRRSGELRHSPWFLVGEKTYTLPAEEAPAAPAPGLEWARVNGAELALRFDKGLDESSAPPAGAFPVSVAGSARGVSAVSVSADTVLLTLAEPVSAGETVTVGYAPPSTGKLRASGGGTAVAAFSGQAVTNDTPARQLKEPPAAQALTASVSQSPAEHRGEGKFTVRVAFSEAVTARAKDAAIQVTGGTLTRAVRVNKRKDLWALSLEPSGYGAVTLTLPAPADCSASGAVCTADGRRLESALTHTVPGPVTVSVADARAKEGEDETLDFQVALSRAASGEVTVRYRTRNGTAKKNKDYRQAKGTLAFAAGETSKTISVELIDDAKDEGEETFTLLLTKATGAVIVDGEAVGTIENDDPMPQAWLARFGRTVAGQAVDAVTERLEAGGGGSHVTLGGQQVSLDSPQGRAEAAAEIEAVAAALGAGPADRWPRDPWKRGGASDDGAGPSSQTMTGRELLLGSAFHLQSQGAAGGPAFAAWGRVATGGFDGEDDGVTMDGTVTTGFLGADVSSGRWLAGAAVALSEGEGAFGLSGAAAGESAFDQGEIESSLTSVLPYARLELNERLTAWAMAGYGTGELTLTEKRAADGENAAVTERHEADLTMTMGALGGRGTLVDAPEGGGFALALKGDAFWVRTESDATEGMEGAKADATRLRLILDASRPFALADGGTLTPSLEVGLRHDGGDAETGTGVELGAGLAWADPASGVSAELRGRWLAAHESSGYEEWGASGSVRIDPGERGRGLSLTLAPTVGAAGSGTGNLWSAAEARGIAPGGTFEAEQRLDAELGYGLAMFGDRFTGTPHAGLALSQGAREYRLGWQLTSVMPGDPGFEIGLDATRRETANDNAPPEHGIGLRMTARW